MAGSSWWCCVEPVPWGALSPRPFWPACGQPWCQSLNVVIQRCHFVLWENKYTSKQPITLLGVLELWPSVCHGALMKAVLKGSRRVNFMESTVSKAERHDMCWGKHLNCSSLLWHTHHYNISISCTSLICLGTFHLIFPMSCNICTCLLLVHLLIMGLDIQWPSILLDSVLISLQVILHFSCSWSSNWSLAGIPPFPPPS